MKNLRVVTELWSQLPLRSDGDEQLSVAAFDPERRRAFIASTGNFIYPVELPNYKQGSGSLLPLEPLEVPLDQDDYIVALEYVIEKEALLLGSSSGCLMLYNIDDGTSEVVGRLDGGVSAIASSPDGALLSITTGLGQLLVMTYDWEVLFEAAVDPQSSNAEVTLDHYGNSGCQIQSSISWRGDGKFFATLIRYESSSSLQKLMIWERDSGTLHSSSQPKPFMGALLDWMPSGAKIAVVYDRKMEEKCPSVAFFERNGLERNSFSISELAECRIEALKWNCNSDLLATLVLCSQYDAVKIWYFSNYHWYVKQEIQFSKKEGIRFMWDPTKPLQLVCWALTGKIITFKFAWSTAVTETSVGCVVDNSHVLVTPLSLSLMPPPMSLFKIKFQSAVKEVQFLSSNLENRIVALLSNGNLCVAILPSAETMDQFEGNEIFVDSCSSGSMLDSLTHLTWVDAHTIIGVSSNGSTNLQCCSFSLIEIDVECENSYLDAVSSSGWHAKISNRLPLEGAVIGITPNPAKRGSCFIQLSGGSILEYENVKPKASSLVKYISEQGTEYRFPFSCPWMKAILCHDKGVARSLLFGLDDDGRLYVGKETISDSCSSFAFYSSICEATERVVTHIVFTTKQDMLFAINVSDIISGNTKFNIASHVSAQTKGLSSKDHIVVWERGAKIVAVLHGDEAAVILQTNRGNLECIYPRRLVLVSIFNALSQGRYTDAVSMVRRHRIDFNLIVDFCGWRAFVKSAADFVSQVNNLSFITEFVCSIKNQNISHKLYKDYVTFPNGSDELEHGGKNHLCSSENKVSSVLKAIRKALEEKTRECPSRELCILTTLARSEPPLLEEALCRIKRIRELELLGTDDAEKKLYPSAEESLRHLLWLSDPEDVFNAALGSYDLNLAAIVALNSQKDPKEFIPFLKGLEVLPPVIMKYTIDVRLHRYNSALKHIVSAGDEYFGDCMKLMNSHPELFPMGIQLFSDNARKKQILEAWGDHLFDQKCFTDAATTYTCCSLYQKAMRAYRSCGDWKGVFTVAGILQFETNQIIELANELCEEFQALGKSAEAAKIALDYCSDVDRGVTYYIAAREWEEAIRVAYLHHREDLLDSLKNAALESAGMLISEYEEGSLKVGKYLARYLAVRQRRLLLAAKLQSEEQNLDVEDDVVSEVSTSFSEMSAYTTRTSKVSSASVVSSSVSKSRGSRRQRKGGRIRAGSAGEETALVEHLKGMALSASAQHELKNLITVLIYLGKEGIAQQLQHIVESFVLHQEAAVRLAEDTTANECIDESIQTLENYVKILKANPATERFCWQIRAFTVPLPVRPDAGR